MRTRDIREPSQSVWDRFNRGWPGTAANDTLRSSPGTMIAVSERFAPTSRLTSGDDTALTMRNSAKTRLSLSPLPASNDFR